MLLHFFLDEFFKATRSIPLPYDISLYFTLHEALVVIGIILIRQYFRRQHGVSEDNVIHVNRLEQNISEGERIVTEKDERL